MHSFFRHALLCDAQHMTRPDRTRADGGCEQLCEVTLECEEKIKGLAHKHPCAHKPTQ